MVSLIIDIVLVAIVLITIFLSAKQGFIKVFLGLVGMVVALVCSLWISGIAAEFVFNKAIATAISSSITQTVENVGTQSAEAIVESMPETLYSAAQMLNVDLNGLIKQGLSNTTNGSAQAISEALVENIAKPLVTSLVRFIIFLILYILIIVLIKLITNTLNLVAKLPLLSSANKLLGGVLGFVKGLVIVCIICFALNTCLQFLPNGLSVIDREALEASRIFSLFSIIKF